MTTQVDTQARELADLYREKGKTAAQIRFHELTKDRTFGELIVLREKFRRLIADVVPRGGEL